MSARSLLYRAAARYSLYNRRRKAETVLGFIESIEAERVLFVGVGGDDDEARTNLFEAAVSAKLSKPVGTGLGHEAPAFASSYVQADGLALPFADRSFDVVVSNAVIEHVGGMQEQALFVAEHLRVGKAAVLTTPNRLFPIEAHTGTILEHCRRGWRDDDGYVTRLLSRRDLRDLLPAQTTIRGHLLAPTLMGLITPRPGVESSDAQVPASRAETHRHDRS